MDDFDNAYEQHEEQEEARKVLEAFARAMEDNPETTDHIVAAQRHAMQKLGGGHVCGLCQKKRRFVRLVEFMVLVNLVNSDMPNASLLYVIEWAWRVPALRLEPFPDLIAPALDLVKWGTDPAMFPQPDWYDKGPMDNEGSHV